MKYYSIAVLLTFNLTLFAQSGIYKLEINNKDQTVVKWTLTLNEDGAFLYHFFRDISAVSKSSNEVNFYGKGTWVLDGKLFKFRCNDDDLSGQYTVNLNNSKARYITKSPRDKSDKVVKTALLFFESETTHIKGLELYKE